MASGDPPPQPPVHYEIRVNGVLGGGWSAWFAGLRVTSDEPGQTTISGAVADQAALHGLLAKVRDLGLPLVSVRQVHSDQPGT
jgi:hypothetical protein